MVTISEIAKKVGVSNSTVSNVLNNKGNVSQETRKKIKEVIEEMGYEEKKHKFSKKNNKNIGVIFPKLSSESDPNYYISEVLTGVEEKINKVGFTLLIESHPYDKQLPSIVHRNLDGLLLIGGQFPEGLLLNLSKLSFPTVTIGTYTLKTPHFSVVADNRMGAIQATSHLIQLGHRKIGLMNGPETTSSSRIKYEGYREALISHHLQIENSWITSCGFSVEEGYQAAQKFLSLKNRPTALFISDDPIAIGALKAFQDAGISVPEDIALVGFGNSSTGKYVSPALSSVDVFQRRLGFFGAKRLLELIDQKNENAESSCAYRIVHSTQLIVRESCGALNTKIKKQNERKELSNEI